MTDDRTETVEVRANGATLYANLGLPDEPRGLVIFAHGSGSSRHSPRNNYVAGLLQDAGLATLLLDLLTEEEEAVDRVTREHRFDIGLLAERLVDAARWADGEDRIGDLHAGLFGSSTGAAAALVAAAREPDYVEAVVSRGGRPDLAGEALDRVKAPTLLIVGGEDHPVIPLNEKAKQRIDGPVELTLVPGATHLFEEPGALDRVAELTRDWFLEHLG